MNYILNDTIKDCRQNISNHSNLDVYMISNLQIRKKMTKFFFHQIQSNIRNKYPSFLDGVRKSKIQEKIVLDLVKYWN